ncbi:MAG: radical SAM protein, partial [Dolichospermum sp.]
PNEYTVGITSLGYQVVWATLATRDDLQVSRLFTDIHEPLPRYPELLGFSMSWELDYVNIFHLLESLEIPIRANSRDQNHPLIFGGGPVLTANPEPYADFFDI